MKSLNSVLSAGLAVLFANGSIAAPISTNPWSAEASSQPAVSSTPIARRSRDIGDGRFKVHLADKHFIPPLGIEQGFAERLTRATEQNGQSHVYVQLQRHVGTEERAELKDLGVNLLGYVGAYVWRASLSNTQVVKYLSNDEARPASLLRLVRWIGEIKSAHRLNPRILSPDIKSSKDGLTYVITQFHEDVPRKERGQVLQSSTLYFCRS
mgnify:CR=1 FL=1